MKNNIFIIFISIILFIVISTIWFFFPSILIKFFHVTYETKDTAGTAGVFGDSFGTLNTLFSGLAFAGIIISIFFQSRELKETRNELIGQKLEFKKQNNSISKQIFENTFFELLKLHHEIVSSLRGVNYKSSSQPALGRDCFDHLLLFYKNYLFHGNSMGVDEDISYENFYNKHCEHVIGHYLRNIYHILKYVDQSKIKDKKFYTNLLRAQISHRELTFIFLNCSSVSGKSKDKPLLEKYEFFEHLPVDKKLVDIEFAKSFKSTAFGDSLEWKEFLLDKQG